MGSFAPPPLSAHEGVDSQFAPPPLSSHEGPENEPSPWQKFTSTLGSGNLAAMGNAALDLPKLLTGDPGAAYRTGQFVTGLVRGMGSEPGRVIDELNAVRGAKNFDEAWQHLTRALPLIGPQGDTILRQIDQGAYAEAAANTVDLVGQFLGPEVAAKYAPSILRAGMRTGMRVAESPVTQAATSYAKTAAPGVIESLPVVGKIYKAGGLARQAAGEAYTRARVGAQNQAAFEPMQPPTIPAAAPQAPFEPPMQPPAIPEEAPAAPPTPEAVAQAARDAHESAFRDQVTQSLTGGSVKKFGDLNNAKAIAAIDSLARQEMARYDQLTQPQPAAPAPPQAPAPQSPPAAPQTPYVPSMPEGTTLQDLLRQDLEAKRAAAQAAAPPETPAAAPETAAGAPEAAEAATPQPKTVEELSNALNEALAEEPAKPKTVEEYKAQARAKRAAATPQWADYLQSKGITADDVAKWSHREKWRFQTQAEDAPGGLTVPTGKGAAAILEELRKREAAAKPQPAAPAEEPRPITPGGVALQPFTVARELAARGVNSTKAADFSGERWRALGVMPNQVAPVIRALQAQERLGMTAVQ